jgi:hypothetical protein
MFNPSREASRRFFAESWRKRRESLPATPMETLVADVIALHPEYHAFVDDVEGNLDKDWSPESGETNPFLHLGLHLAIAEQLQVDQPPGVRAAHAALTLEKGNRHDADHAVMDCLAEQIWQNQRNGLPFDNARYLACMRGLGSVQNVLGRE